MNFTAISYSIGNKTVKSVLNNGIVSPLLKNSSITYTVNVPIHIISNRGKLQTPGSIMTLSANLNSYPHCSVDYDGFPIPTSMPSSVTNSYVTITTNSITDNYASGNEENKGFYLDANVKIDVSSSGFIDQNAANVVTATQTFHDNTTTTATYSFYYDTPITTNPSGKINSISISKSDFKQVSGIYVLGGSPILTVEANANNMGYYFYVSPLITYTSSIGQVNTIKEETTLSNASGYSNGKITDGNLIFTSTFNSNSLANTTGSSVTVSAVIYNAHNTNGTNVTLKTINVTTDGRSYFFVYNTLPTIIQTLNNSGVTGFRIWSAPSISNNCPDLTYGISNQEYYNISYDNSWDISKTNNGYDATTELIVYSGSFTTSSNAYANYSNSLYNDESGIDYSTITTIGYRFATFCWKFPTSNTAFTTMSFTINSSVNNMFYSNGVKILMNTNVTPLIFYAIRDESAPNNYTTNNINTVWINANSNNPQVGSGNYFDITNNRYGSLGGFLSISEPATLSSGNKATINVFIPGVKPSSSTYLYLRIGLPMEYNNLSFTTVTAKIT
jgi:hypothetical protein